MRLLQRDVTVVSKALLFDIFFDVEIPCLFSTERSYPMIWAYWSCKKTAETVFLSCTQRIML